MICVKIFACDEASKVNPSADGLIVCFFSESSILAQNERWQRGLGMQVERKSADSSRKVRICGG